MDTDGVLAKLLKVKKTEAEKTKYLREVKVFRKRENIHNIITVGKIPKTKQETHVRVEEKTKLQRPVNLTYKPKNKKKETVKNKIKRKKSNTSFIVKKTKQQIESSVKRCSGGFAEGCACGSNSSGTYATKQGIHK